MLQILGNEKISISSNICAVYINLEFNCFKMSLKHGVGERNIL